MHTFLQDLLRSRKQQCTVIVLDEDGVAAPKQYQIRPRRFMGVSVLFFFALSFGLAGTLMFSPLRVLIPGYDASEVRQDARMSVLRIAALQDSLALQQVYVSQLRHLITGQVDSAFAGQAAPAPPLPSVASSLSDLPSSPLSEDWGHHAQPAIALEQMPIEPVSSFRPVFNTRGYLSGLRLPLMPPVDGFMTRGFDALSGHYAVDIAVAEGTAIRSVGDGYVVFADWTRDGGYAIVVQHAGGFVSMYKHNLRLLKQVGDRVRDREAIALSGNSGEATTGPHLHFELWHEGLAQDPRNYFIGW